MTLVLARKLLRDVAVGLAVVCLLLFAFQCLWAKVTDRIVNEILARIAQFMPLEALGDVLFQGSGQMLQALMGGESIRFERAFDLMTVGYVHPLAQTMLCIWAVGRASGAIAGEIDRGTMELLLAQPVRRRTLLAAHLLVDLVAIPALCVSMWAGTWLGAYLVGFLTPTASQLRVEPLRFAPALLNVGLLVFAVSGYTMLLSAAGRFRWRVLGIAVLLTLVQFLVNVIAQLWPDIEVLRPFTVFYYYQPQPMILEPDGPWYEQGAVWLRLGVLLAVGAGGYLLALVVFVRRDLPAPL